MGIKSGYRTMVTEAQLAEEKTDFWFMHYFQYLTSLAYQLFEWKGLPDSVDPRYMEMMIHEMGYVGFFKHPTMGYLATQGTPSGQVDHYLLPTDFNPVSPANLDFPTFKVYQYLDIEPKEEELYGCIIWNNDYHFSSLPSLRMFAEKLAHIQQIIYINANAQKTPVLIFGNDKNRFSLENAYKKYEGNSPMIYFNEKIDPKALQVFKTDAPYVVDKLNDHKNALWNEVMTWLGIKNANMDKKERLVTDEVNSNDEQIEASANVFLKSRQEACDRINKLYDLNVSVEIRHDIIEQFQNNIDRGGENGDLHNDNG